MTVKRNKKHCQLLLPGSIFLLLVLCWLSVCISIQYQSQRVQYHQTEEQDGNCGILLEDQDEKTPFLTEAFFSPVPACPFLEGGLYFFSDGGAFIVNACHQELFSPPPNLI